MERNSDIRKLRSKRLNYTYLSTYTHVHVYEFVLKCDIEIIAYSCMFERYSAI